MPPLWFPKIWQHLQNPPQKKINQWGLSHKTGQTFQKLSSIKNKQTLSAQNVLYHPYLLLYLNASCIPTCLPSQMESTRSYAKSSRRKCPSCLRCWATWMGNQSVRRVSPRKHIIWRRILYLSRHNNDQSLFKNKTGEKKDNDSWSGCSSRKWSRKRSYGWPRNLHSWLLQPQHLPSRLLSTTSHQKRWSNHRKNQWSRLCAESQKYREGYGQLCPIVCYLQRRNRHPQWWSPWKTEYNRGGDNAKRLSNGGDMYEEKGANSDDLEWRVPEDQCLDHCDFHWEPFKKIWLIIDLLNYDKMIKWSGFSKRIFKLS
mgnify:CR=1 FL=1